MVLKARVLLRSKIVQPFYVHFSPHKPFRLKPWIPYDVLDVRTLDEIVSEHGENELLAFFRNAAEVFPRKRKISLRLQDHSILAFFVERHGSRHEDV